MKFFIVVFVFVVGVNVFKNVIYIIEVVIVIIIYCFEFIIVEYGGIIYIIIEV